MQIAIGGKAHSQIIHTETQKPFIYDFTTINVIGFSLFHLNKYMKPTMHDKYQPTKI